MRQIPVVDLQQIGIHHEEEVPINLLEKVADEIREAFSGIGFVYIKNHGISWRKVEEVHRVCGNFFQLPEDVKWKSKFDVDKRRQGYSGTDHELLNSKSNHEIRESYNVGTLDGHFPPEVPEMRTSVSDLALDCQKLIVRLLRVLSIALGLEDHTYLEKTHQDLYTESNGTTIRILYYPPVLNTSANAVRCGEHSDYGTITLLFQDDIGGLEVQNVDKEWVPAPPIDNTILVNVGDLLQIWSGGKFPATRHRVLIPKDEELRKKARHALTCFVHPDNHVMVSPLDGSTKYKAVNALESLTRKFQSTYQY